MEVFETHQPPKAQIFARLRAMQEIITEREFHESKNLEWKRNLAEESFEPFSCHYEPSSLK